MNRFRLWRMSWTIQRVLLAWLSAIGLIGMIICCHYMDLRGVVDDVFIVLLFSAIGCAMVWLCSLITLVFK